MKPKFTDTVAMWAPTRVDGVGYEGVFTSEVKVLLSWHDVETAVEVGAVVPSEAYALWAYWAAPGSPGRVAAQALLQGQEPAASRLVVPVMAASESESVRPVVAAPTLAAHGLEHAQADAGPMHTAHLAQIVGVSPWLRVFLGVSLSSLLVWAAGLKAGYW